MPLIWQAAEPQANLAAYASLHLQDEVQGEALVRQIGDFSRIKVGLQHAPPLKD